MSFPITWTTTSLSEVCTKIVDGSHNPPKAVENGFPMLSAKNIYKRKVFFDDYRLISKEDFEIENNRTNISSGDVLLTIVGAIGRGAVVNEGLDKFTLQRSVAVLKPFQINPKYLSYALEAPKLQKYLQDNAKGTAQKGIYLKALSAVTIPLAPLNEQRRIADKLDTTLARVDTLNDRLARITPLLKRFRQSVLAAATSGRLTEDWRQNKDISTFSWKAITEFREQILPDLPNSWKWVEFSEVASVQSDLRDPSEYQNEIHLAPNHIEPWSGKISGCQTIADDAVKSPKHWFNAGQIVYSKIRPNLCKVAIPNFSGLCSADMYPISTKLNDSYLLLWMLGERFTSWASNAESRTVLPKINTKELGKIPVPVTSAEEQTEIVRRVETLLAFADRLEARLQSAQTAAERLTPALLAKAFRGELVPQDPSDEPATELLRRLREARAADTASKPKRGRAAKAPTVSE